LLIFRHDQMSSYEYHPEGDSLALQSWMLSEALPPIQVREVTGPKGPNGLRGQVMAMHTQFPGNSYEGPRYWNMVISASDSVLEWPYSRFDKDMYYTTDSDASVRGLSYTNHCGCVTVDEVFTFDNAIFNISDEEAGCMSINQRMWMEVGYVGLYKAGYDKKSLPGKDIGVYLGDVGSDWHSLTPYVSIIKYNPDITAMSIHSAVCCTRMSHVHGLTGPSMTFDTACSASLVATHHGHLQMINFKEDDRENEGSLCGGTNTLGPIGYVGNCAAQMLSHIGRCFTYDRTADGYQRGEGTGSMFCTLSEDASTVSGRIAVIAGTCANQDGRSASLTAPNGPSQQAVLRKSLQMAQIPATYVTVVECHGTGTALGDPIEVGAVLAVMEDTRVFPLPHTSAKSNIAHLEAAAGIAGLLKCLNMLLHSTATPNVNLRTLNAHLESKGFPSIMETEAVDFGPDQHCGYAGVSSFGFGGTNSRGDLYARCVKGPRAGRPVERKIIREEQWMRIKDALLSLEYEGDDISSLFRVDQPIEAVMAQPYGGHPDSTTDIYLAGGEPVVILERSVDGALALVEDRHTRRGWVPSLCLEPKMEEPDPVSICVTGTWDNWSTLEEMEQVEPGVYVLGITLGETRWEEFQIVLNEDRTTGMIYPFEGKASASVRISGPNSAGHAKNWLIDGIADGAAAGTVYKVRFEWGAPKRMFWEPVTKDLPDKVLSLPFKHQYFIVGSWSYWQLQEMKPLGDEEGAEMTFVIGRNKAEHFQIVRDRDWTQVIYPALGQAEDESIPVMGPDDNGSGKNWIVQGDKGCEVHVVFRIVNGQVSVTLDCAGSSKRFTSSERIAPRSTYFVAASFNGWSLEPMSPDPNQPGVHRIIATVGMDRQEEFQIVVNADWKKTMYPLLPKAQLGQSFTQGPDGQGHDKNWQITGYPGQNFCIVLNLNEEDGRRIVTWEPAKN